MFLKIIAILMLFNLSAAFAGDLYLVCEKADGEDMHSITLESNRAMLIVNIDDQTPILIQLNKTKNTNVSEFKVKLKNLRNNQKETLYLKIAEEFQIGDFSCAVRD